MHGAVGRSGDLWSLEAVGPVGERLLDVFRRLFEAFGPQHWWPADEPFEVCVGAILTQNTSWNNVSRAISRLKSKGLLNIGALCQVPVDSLAAAIRPAGYYNLKARRLKGFVDFLVSRHEGSLERLFSLGLKSARQALLEVKGIGPETADSILLYAGGLPTFVVDAYTIRALRRHDLVSDDSGYEDIRALFMDYLPSDVALFNEFHALWVALGKGFCKRGMARCEACPLRDL